MEIPLCKINAGYNHEWRFVFSTVNDIRGGSLNGVWQCNQCHRIELGRPLTGIEVQARIKGEEIIDYSVGVPT